VQTAEKIFLGFTIIAVVSTIFTSKYTSSITGAASGGLAKVYTAVKH
jgi:hypothetical protein